MHFPIDERFEFVKLEVPSTWLSLESGGKWLGGKFYRAPGKSPSSKLGVLDKGGAAPGTKPLDDGGGKYSAKEKAAIMKREEEMKAKEMGAKSAGVKEPIKRRQRTEEDPQRRARLAKEIEVKVRAEEDKAFAVMDELKALRKYVDDRVVGSNLTSLEGVIEGRKPLSKKKLNKLYDQMNNLEEKMAAHMNRAKQLEGRARNLFR
jgi:hypothetical protein